MAIAPVIYKQISIEGKILFNEGSQRSFISMKLANKLNLQTITGEKINILVLIVPTIALPLQNPLCASIKE